jgi:hypothetical protein
MMGHSLWVALPVHWARFPTLINSLRRSADFLSFFADLQEEEAGGEEEEEYEDEDNYSNVVQVGKQ